MNTQVIIADYNDAQHSQHSITRLNSDACAPEGGGEPLTDWVQGNLVRSLQALPGAFSVLSYVAGLPVGLVNCLQGFSTFQCKPLINIHDVIVETDYRNRGISQKMLQLVEQIALERDCCKLTLEVLSANQAARRAYQKFGFQTYALDPAFGHAQFWQKNLVVRDNEDLG